MAPSLPMLTQSLVPVADESKVKITHNFLIVETNRAAHLRNGQFTETGIEPHRKSHNIGGESSVYLALHLWTCCIIFGWAAEHFEGCSRNSYYLIFWDLRYALR